MPLPKHEDKRPVNCSIEPDLGQLDGRSAVVTGGECVLYILIFCGSDSVVGASGIGRAYTEALIKAGYANPSASTVEIQESS